MGVVVTIEVNAVFVLSETEVTGFHSLARQGVGVQYHPDFILTENLGVLF
jgi:anthranilate/para-aminobenzoate synthase component II